MGRVLFCMWWFTHLVKHPPCVPWIGQPRKLRFELSCKRFAFYGRLSTTDKQDPALSFPSQRKACERKVPSWGQDHLRVHRSGIGLTRRSPRVVRAHPGGSRPRGPSVRRRRHLLDLTAGARRLPGSHYHRELQAVGVSIHYATGGGDATNPKTTSSWHPTGFDQFERDKLSRETKRGMREASEQGYRAGGRAPYGYRRELHGLDDDHLGDREKSHGSPSSRCPSKRRSSRRSSKDSPPRSSRPRRSLSA